MLVLVTRTAVRTTPRCGWASTASPSDRIVRTVAPTYDTAGDQLADHQLDVSEDATGKPRGQLFSDDSSCLGWCARLGLDLVEGTNT